MVHVRVLDQTSTVPEASGPVGSICRPCLQALTMEPVDSDASPSTSEYVMGHRLDAGMSIEELAARVGVSARWLAAFESGEATAELTYDLLLRLVRATQPPRPEWWDEGHEHDLHLGPAGVSQSHRTSHPDYWARIEAVRAVNRSSRGRA